MITSLILGVEVESIKYIRIMLLPNPGGKGDFLINITVSSKSLVSLLCPVRISEKNKYLFTR